MSTTDLPIGERAGSAAGSEVLRLRRPRRHPRRRARPRPAGPAAARPGLGRPPRHHPHDPRHRPEPGGPSPGSCPTATRSDFFRDQAPPDNEAFEHVVWTPRVDGDSPAEPGGDAAENADERAFRRRRLHRRHGGGRSRNSTCSASINRQPGRFPSPLLEEPLCTLFNRQPESFPQGIAGRAIVSAPLPASASSSPS